MTSSALTFTSSSKGNAQAANIAMADDGFYFSAVGDGGEEWVRPADWLPMSTSGPESIDLLAAVFDHDSNYCSVRIDSGADTYDVDWGDGTSDIGIASNTLVNHLYDYNNPLLVGTESSRGYRQALVRITPTSGIIVGAYFGDKPTNVTLPSLVSQPWLDAVINAPNLTGLSFFTSATGAVSLYIERVNIVAIGDITSLDYTFYLCRSLNVISFPAGSLSGVLSMLATFSNCVALRAVEFPAGSLALVTEMRDAFGYCYALESITFPAGSLANVTSMRSTFLYCVALEELQFPAGSLANVTTLQSCFEAAGTREIDFPVGSLGLVTNMQSALSGGNLQRVFFPAGSLGRVTTTNLLFNQARLLASITFPAGAFPLLTVTTNMFISCSSLAEILGCVIPSTFSVANLKLSGAALDEIYTALPVVVGRTITVTGNYGTATHTPSIATLKGWTVVT